jgi:hypothetical protein
MVDMYIIAKPSLHSTLSMLSSAQVARYTASVLRWIVSPVAKLGIVLVFLVSYDEYFDNDISAVEALLYISFPIHKQDSMTFV